MTSKTSSFIGATGPPSQAMRKLRPAQLVGLTLLTVFLASGISITIGCRPIIGAKAWRLTEYFMFAAADENPLSHFRSGRCGSSYCCVRKTSRSDMF